MMFVLGNYLGKLKRNWFVGIKSPWTLSSENVWNKTHRLAGKLFMIWGLGIMIAPWFKSNLAMGVLLSGIIIIVIFINIYSYFLFKKEKNKIGLAYKKSRHFRVHFLRYSSFNYVFYIFT